jgi:hypothetical protein
VPRRADQGGGTRQRHRPAEPVTANPIMGGELGLLRPVPPGVAEHVGSSLFVVGADAFASGAHQRGRTRQRHRAAKRGAGAGGELSLLGPRGAVAEASAGKCRLCRFAQSRRCRCQGQLCRRLGRSASGAGRMEQRRPSACRNDNKGGTDASAPAGPPGPPTSASQPRPWPEHLGHGGHPLPSVALGATPLSSAYAAGTQPCR